MINTFKTKIDLILTLTVQDIKARYLGTFLGVLWALISPLVTIGLIYFVFTFGFRANTVMQLETPFINWLSAGFLIWFYISDSITNGCTAISSTPHLVTKLKFDISLLPISKVISPLIPHIFLMTTFIILLAIEGKTSFWLLPQVLYYLFCAIILSYSITVITATCMIFVKDTTNFVGVIVQMLFWATPIFWDPQMISNTRFKWLLLSPFNYIVSGYRDSLFFHNFFWNHKLETAVFWLTTLSLLLIGKFLFNRTKLHFADIL